MNVLYLRQEVEECPESRCQSELSSDCNEQIIRPHISVNLQGAPEKKGNP